MDVFIGSNRNRRTERFAAAGMLFFDGQLRGEKFAAAMGAPNEVIKSARNARNDQVKKPFLFSDFSDTQNISCM
jgi:hypothetical protein